jgi:hypothetical protein
MKRVLLTAALLFALGCAESFEPASFVDKLRPVAALVEVEGDPSRANPDPGDVITVTQHIIDCPRAPEPEDTDSDDEDRFANCEVSNPAIEWRFVACVPIETVFNPPICARLIEPCENCVNEDVPLAEDPVVRFQVPAEAELGGAEQVVLQGGICEGEIASQERLVELLFGGVEELNPCANPEQDEGRLISVRILIEQGAPPNHNPQIALPDSPEFAFGRPEDWSKRWLNLPSKAPKTGCLTDIEDKLQCIPSTAGNGRVNILLSVTPASLEKLPDENGDPQSEEIQISWLADDGQFDRSFSFIDDKDNPFESVLWGLPSETAADGTYVRFNFVIRDGRGGTAWEERGLCIVPSDAFGKSPCN